MNRKLISLTVGLSGAILLSGCATAFGGGSTQKISVKAETTGSISMGYLLDDNKTVERIQDFKAPDIITVKRENKNLIFKDSSGKCQDKIVKKDSNPWIAGDILAMSPLSTTVDYLTGAIWIYDDNVTLECK
jgi:hypothetical protein